MKDKIQILSLLKSAKPRLQKLYPIGEIGLFGSRARGDYNDKSDIDLLIEIKGEIGLEFMQLANDLEILFDEKVDLITRNSLRPNAFNHISKDLIYA